ncbi:MAG: UDP-N-acetylmuramoyl-tripeptide--D-alanyl-D-alanine ligase, partial [Christensenellaceae bacterium]|nr:UDP-N-acetylmuramoyl-tripeptide--D-alanyl-D-alanine ligase [Christensenellaceae bacterium]
MIKLTAGNIAKMVGGTLVGNDELQFKEIDDITLDSRRAKKGSLFVAIKGEKVDGHDYIDSALEKGAVLAISERDVTGCHIRVQSSLEAMQRIAAYLREVSGVKVVAVTGSVGKTSTRQMIACVLNKKFNILSTEGNFNNEYGLPQTLFRLEPWHEIAVLELGISHFGEMSRLGAIARPDYAVYTNIGSMHLENLIDRDGVLKAKTELVDFMPSSGRLFLNGDDDKLRSYHAPISSVYFGMDENYPIYPSDIVQLGMERTRFTLHLYGETAEIDLPATGIYMIQNAVAAANVAHELGMSLDEIKAGIESYTPVGHRGRVIRANGITIVDDCYNAGPDSMRAAISALRNDGGRRIALLGDMLELGEKAVQLHHELGVFCAEAGLDALFTVGTLSKNIAIGARESGMKNVFCVSEGDAAQMILDYIRPDDVLLVKASRGMRFETIIE